MLCLNNLNINPQKHLFGNEAAARRWLEQPRATLGGLSPLEFAHMQPDGEQYIINLLGRTAYGAYS